MLRQRKEFLDDDDETSLRYSGGTRREHGGIDHWVRNGPDNPVHGRFSGREFEQLEQFEQLQQFEHLEWFIGYRWNGRICRFRGNGWSRRRWG